MPCIAWCNRDGCKSKVLLRLVNDIGFIPFRKMVLSLPMSIETEKAELDIEKKFYIVMVLFLYTTLPYTL